ncbi:MAG: ribosome small subunit-dependent GTPase A [Candidatus Limivicinus sp.]
MDMKDYGLSRQQAEAAAGFEGLTVARVIAQEKGLYRVAGEKGEKLGEITGRLRYQAETVSAFPAVGDFVMADWNQGGGNAVIHQVLPRRSCFLRKAAGETRHEQLVAANIDTVFLCMALNRDFNLRRLERYLSTAWDSGATPVIVLTKADLCADLEGKLLAVSAVAMGVQVLSTTMAEAGGYDQIRPYIRKGETVAFLGSSGAGKSTMINHLLGEERLETKGLRNDDKGRHTTTRRELILLPGGGMVIDTPGMRELGMWDSEEGIDRTFADIEELTKQCRFHDCSHSGEPGCAIRQALEQGLLAPERWQSYQKLKTENAYMEDSRSYLLAKEQKFKEIARINKNNKGKRK